MSLHQIQRKDASLYDDFIERVNNSTNIQALSNEKASILWSEFISYSERNIKIKVISDRIEALTTHITWKVWNVLYGKFQ